MMDEAIMSICWYRLLIARTIKSLIVITIFLLIPYALWSGYQVSKLPGITHTEDGIQIHNCDEPRDENARLVCPDLYCEKEIRNSGKLGGKSLLHVSGVTHSKYSNISVIAGSIKIKDTAEHPSLYFYCRMDGDKVTESSVMTEEEWVRRSYNGKFNE